MADNRKIGGILLEASIRGQYIESVIAGIGININQKHFSKDLVATSVYNLTGRVTPLLHVLALLCQQLEQRYENLKAGMLLEQMEEYNKALYAKGEQVVFAFGNEVHKGVVKGVRQDGTLEIVTSGGTKRFHFNEIKLKYLGTGY
jgi:BirA family transcriptional regulator, biotin operon repressor / biotin---[acetyl-CoA-carboxylase] ligase